MNITNINDFPDVFNNSKYAAKALAKVFKKRLDEEMKTVDSLIEDIRLDCYGKPEKTARFETILSNFRGNDDWHTW